MVPLDRTGFHSKLVVFVFVTGGPGGLITPFFLLITTQHSDIQRVEPCHSVKNVPV